MGNTIISSLLFQPPSPPNELDYFGSSTNNRSAHNASGNESSSKGKGSSVGGGGHSSSSSRGGGAVAVNTSIEPSLHYIWLVAPNHPLPIPALHIQHSPSKPSATPSANRYTLLYSHGNAEDIGLLAKFLTDISKLLQVDILVYDYTGYGASVDRHAVLRFYAVWGAKLEEWKRWRKANLTRPHRGAGSSSGDATVEEKREGFGSSTTAAASGMKYEGNGVSYSMDVFMAPMVFPKGTSNSATTVSSAASTTSSSSKRESSSSSSTTLNLPDNVYVGGDELDFIEEDATTVATSDGGRRSRSRSEAREGSLLDIEDDDDDDDDNDDMPSVTATCYDNSTLCDGERDEFTDEEDEVSLFTCGASCNEVEHTSIVDAAVELDDEMDDDPTAFSSSTLSSSYHHHQARSVSGSSTANTAALSASQRRGRRRRTNRQGSLRTPLTPKQKRRALLRKFKWTMPSPSEEQCYGDILLAYTYLLQIKGISSKHILLYGKSVGSGPTCWLTQRSCQGGSVEVGKDGVYDSSSSSRAAVGRERGVMYEDVRDDGDVDYRDERLVGESGTGGQSDSGGSSLGTPGGVILHSPFLSVIRVVMDMGFTTVGDLFPNIDRVTDFTCPVYIIHGTEDEIVPYYHGQGLFDSLPDTSKAVPFWAKGAGHNNIEMEMPTAYIKRLMQFIRQCDRLNYPAGELLRSRAFSSGSAGNTTNHHRRGTSQQELDNMMPNRKHSRMSVSKQRKKKGSMMVKRGSSSPSSSHSSSPTMMGNTMSTTTSKRRQQGGRRNSQQRQQYQQQQCGRDQYPSVETNLSTDAAICGFQPSVSVESKYYNQYLQQQQQQEQRQEQNYY